MSRVGPGRSLWAVPLLLFVAVLLVAGLAFNLANLDTGGEAVPTLPDAGGTEPTPLSVIGLLPLIQAIVAVLGLLVIGLLAYMILRRPKRKDVPYRSFRRSELIRTLVFFLIFLLILWAYRQGNPASNGAGETPPEGTGSGGFLPSDLPTFAGIPLAAFVAGSLFAALAVLAIVFRPTVVVGREPTPRAPEGRRAAAKAVEVAIGEIELGADVRSAILLCFRRFLELLGARGLEDQEVLTPREIEGLAVSRLGVSRDAAAELTSLFEVARYSEHPLSETDRASALESLERIRAALEA